MTMNQNQIIEAAKQLIAIRSTADNLAGLREAYAFVHQRILASNKPIAIEEFESNGKPSLLAYHAGQRPEKFHVLLNAHLDVVPGKPDQYKAVVSDDTLYGRGAYDMKVAAIILADLFCEFVDTVPYALGIQIVIDEETSGLDGTNYQIQQGVRSDFIICGECGRSPGTYEIANATKGMIQTTVDFTGSTSHGAYPWRGDNAALKAAHFATRLHEYYPVPAEATSGTTVTLTSILTTNDAYNKVPDHAVAHLDTRYVATDIHCATPESFEAHLRSIDPNISRVTIRSFSKPMHTESTDPLLLALKASAERIENHTFELVQRNGSNDGRFYTEVGGRACDFGIVGENQHGDGECVTLQAIWNYQATLRDFLSKTAQDQQLLENVHAVDPIDSV
jgi:succinyl-diaminopimelate desuccinylase